MITFLALYRGPDIERATVIAVTADPHLVRQFATAVLQAENTRLTRPAAGTRDPIVEAVSEGRREALELVRDEAGTDAGEDHSE